MGDIERKLAVSLHKKLASVAKQCIVLQTKRGFAAVAMRNKQ